VPAPPLSPTRRYLPPGIRKCYFVFVIANYLLPTRAELNSGLDVSAEIPTGGVTGFSLQGSTADAGDMGSKFTSTVAGRLTSGTNSIDSYLDSGDVDVRTLLPRLTTGNVVWMWAGDIPGGLMDVWPVQVLTQAIDPNTEDVAKVTIQFAATRVPAINVRIPA